MSDAKPNSIARNTFGWIPLVLGVGSYLLVVFSSITALYPARWPLGIASLVLFATFLLQATYCLLRTRWVRAFSYVLPHIAIVIILLSWAATRMAGFDILDAIRLNLFSRTACIQSAADLGHGAVFGVCVAHFDNLSITGNLIVYDSSDEIALPAESRSPEWMKAVFGLKNTPFGELEFRAKKMVDHFYDVEFFESY